MCIASDIFSYFRSWKWAKGVLMVGKETVADMNKFTQRNIKGGFDNTTKMCGISGFFEGTRYEMRHMNIYSEP